MTGKEDKRDVSGSEEDDIVAKTLVMDKLGKRGLLKEELKI